MVQKNILNIEEARELGENELSLICGGTQGSPAWPNLFATPQTSSHDKAHAKASKIDYAQGFEALQNLTSGLLQNIL